MSKFFAVCLFLALVGQSSVSFADVIYKYTGKNGAVTYTNIKPPGSVKFETIEVATLSPEQRRAVLMMRAQQKQKDQAALEQIRAKQQEWRQADQEILDAQAALKKAEKDLENGRAPRPGETKGTAGGYARLTQSYFQRLEAMENTVKEAKARLDQAYQARNQLM